MMKERGSNERERTSLVGVWITLCSLSISSPALFRRNWFTLQDKVMIYLTDAFSPASGVGQSHDNTSGDEEETVKDGPDGE